MPNIVNPDCGWNDSLRLAFVETTNDALQDPDGYDVQFSRNAYITLTENLTVTGFQNMVDGVVYKLLAMNTSGNSYTVTFPSTCLKNTFSVSAGNSAYFRIMQAGENIVVLGFELAAS